MNSKTAPNTALSPAPENIIDDHLIRYARAIARKISRRFRLSQADEEELGNIGIAKLPDLVARYDRSRGATLITFITFRLRGSMIDHVRQVTQWNPKKKKRYKIISLGASRNLVELFFSGKKKQSGDADPISLEERARLAGAAQSEPDPETAAERRILRTIIQKTFAELPEQERTIIILYYFEGKTFAEIGKTIDRETSWVSRLHRRALAKLRVAVQANET